MSKIKDETKRQRILGAATKVFAQKGFALSKISEIAREAGVADGTIYLYFANKDDLLVAVFEYNLDQIIPLMREALAQTDAPLDKLHLFVRKHLSLIGEHRDLSRVFQIELQQTHKFMQEKNNRKLKEYLDLLLEVIEEGQKTGLIRSSLNPKMARHVIFGALYEVALSWIKNQEKAPSLAQSADQILDIVLGGLTAQSEMKSTKPTLSAA